MEHDEHYMRRCIQIAKHSVGLAAPNPAVGCIIVFEDKIIGEGYTSPVGGAHAEVNALNTVQNKELLKRSTLYVTLEPCSHHGKTPPCTDLIIKQGVRRVVIGCADPNPKVSGQGIKLLEDSGCEVRIGILKDVCRQHHHRFLSYFERHRPYIILKWAQTKSGFIAPKIKDDLKPVWISNLSSRQLTHKWRTEEQAILVGSKTVKDDNPSLTARLWHGRNPIRVVLGQIERLDKSAQIFDRSSGTIAIDTLQLDRKKPIAKQVCTLLYKKEINSILIEGGSKTINSFIKENLWDEARVFTGLVDFDDGIKAPVLNIKPSDSYNISGDKLDYYFND
ncbi:MAG: bifunctional diaminohydroxyphosphoribosylaminopyrimidine deaminase/5-amino-6-(5-phosphoribosylamino)uracil reductase RibD [Flavobacteriaceae bacterium]|nr:bifunctional diaminohydroxyphosphoribosylaminopyrimidine deaminase/5-amino-6-(5-phosphoribosylamino)uracil reductase RibD [Flavobacteriaceae bacterium]